MRLAVALYKQLTSCKDFGLRDQIQRAAVSIPSNIAEGYDRNSNKEFIQFFYIAKGSCSELRTQLYIASEVGVIETRQPQISWNKQEKYRPCCTNSSKQGRKISADKKFLISASGFRPPVSVYTLVKV